MAEPRVAAKTPQAPGNPSPDLVRLENVEKHFPVQSGLLANILNRGNIPAVKAVDGVSFTIKRGEVFGLAGESGSGKSTVGRLVLNLLSPTGGRVLFDDMDLAKLSSEEMRKLRSRMQIIFQDPMASLNPRMTIGEAIGHPVRIHVTGEPAKLREVVSEILEKVGLAPAAQFYDKYPHQISGGQRQRAVIARALVTVPDLVVADEPIAMADVSVRALLLELMMRLKDELNLTYLFITHDLATAKYVCDRIAVMYLGKLCEVGPLREVYEHSAHPYTRALLEAVPVPDPRHRRTEPMPAGEIPNAINPPSGCRFHPRCPLARENCSVEEPVLRELRPGHYIACHYAEELLK
ncbi:MAG: ABC transporter ATP-binding protein [Anaerolineales bacterium]|jgi:peptide/nickel transport system ATP-binding protein